MTCAASHIMLLVGLAVHITTEYSTTATCIETLQIISPISSTYLVIWPMNAVLPLLVCIRNHWDLPSFVNKKCSTQLYQSHRLNLNMWLVCGNEGSPVTEVWHITHFWTYNGRCTMPGLPWGWSDGLSW